MERSCCSTSSRTPIRYGRRRYSAALRESSGSTPRHLRFRLTILPSPSSTGTLSRRKSRLLTPMEATSEKPSRLTRLWLPASLGRLTAGYLAYTFEGPTEGSLHTWSLEQGSDLVVRTEPTLLSRTNLPSLVWLPDGRLIFGEYGPSEQGTAHLSAMPMDLRTGKSAGNPVPITNWHGDYAWSPTVSLDGRRLVVSKGHTKTDIFLSELKQKGQRAEGAKNLTLGRQRRQPECVVCGQWLDANRFRSNDKRSDLPSIPGRKEPQAIVPETDSQTGAEITPDGAWIMYWSFQYDENGNLKSQGAMRVSSAGGTPERTLKANPTKLPTFIARHIPAVRAC